MVFISWEDEEEVEECEDATNEDPLLARAY